MTIEYRTLTITTEGRTVSVKADEAPRVIEIQIATEGSGGGTGPQGPQGPQGPAGPAGADGQDGQDGAPGAAATISVGTVTTGAAGSNATVTNAGNSSAAVFNFSIPRGPQGVAGANGAPGADGQDGVDGAPGTAATIAVGTVTTGAPGSNAVVTNAGNSSVAVFNITIPRGDKGEQGEQGIQGIQGPAGANGTNGTNGANGAPGAAATISVGTVTTGAPGSNVIVTNTGNSSVAVLSFTIPRGDVGATGANGAQGPTGNTGAPGATGANGMSAYQVAVANGFEGTEVEWLDSLAYGDPIQGTWTMSNLANPPKIWFDFDQGTSNVVTTATLSQVPTLITSQFNPAYTANTDLCILQAQNANFGLRRTLHLLGSGSRVNINGANSLFKAKMKHTQIILMRMFTEGVGAPGTQTPYIFVGGNGSGVARHSLGQTATSVASLRMGGRANDGDTFDGNDYTGNLGSMPILAFAEWDHTVGRKRLWLWGELIGEDTGYFTSPTANTDSSYIGLGSFTSTQTGNPNWEIACVGIHDDTFTTDERQRIEGYIARRARLSHYLVDGHPYKETPPMV